MPYKDKEKQKAYQREWAASRRREWLDKNGPCVKCGSYEDLEVDHKNPENKVSHNVWSWSEDRKNAELAKCQVLCWSCHLQKTRTEKSKLDLEECHGSFLGYTKFKCRCGLCREYKRQAHRREKVRGGCSILASTPGCGPGEGGS